MCLISHLGNTSPNVIAANMALNYDAAINSVIGIYSYDWTATVIYITLNILHERNPRIDLNGII